MVKPTFFVSLYTEPDGTRVARWRLRANESVFGLVFVWRPDTTPPELVRLGLAEADARFARDMLAMDLRALIVLAREVDPTQRPGETLRPWTQRDFTW